MCTNLVTPRPPSPASAIAYAFTWLQAFGFPPDISAACLMPELSMTEATPAQPAKPAELSAGN